MLGEGGKRGGLRGPKSGRGSGLCDGRSPGRCLCRIFRSTNSENDDKSNGNNRQDGRNPQEDYLLLLHDG